jgi:hypothetical protein
VREFHLLHTQLHPTLRLSSALFGCSEAKGGEPFPKHKSEVNKETPEELRVRVRDHCLSSLGRTVLPSPSSVQSFMVVVFKPTELGFGLGLDVLLYF